MFHLANKYEDIVNLRGAGVYCGGLPHSLFYNVKQAVREAATICPRPLQVDL